MGDSSNDKIIYTDLEITFPPEEPPPGEPPPGEPPPGEPPPGEPQPPDHIKLLGDALTKGRLKCKKTDLPFPTHYSLAWAANEVYKVARPPPKQTITDDSIDKPNSKESTEDNVSEKDQWELICTASNPNDGYFGCIFVHKEFNFAILAHRGTVTTATTVTEVKAIIKTLKTDMEGIVRNKMTSQINSACTFTALFNQAMAQVNNNGLCYRTSITGHSLGGWLAQITAFSSKYLKQSYSSDKLVVLDDTSSGNHLHCVAFDSPGTKHILERIYRAYNKSFYDRKLDSLNVDGLDITIILGIPNAVNTLNEQVGLVLKLDLDIETEKPGFFRTQLNKIVDNASKLPIFSTLISSIAVEINKKTHDIQHFVKALQKKNTLYEVINWPLIICESYNTKRSALGASNLKALHSVGNQFKYNKELSVYKDLDKDVFLIGTFNPRGLQLLKKLKLHFSWYQFHAKINVSKFEIPDIDELISIQVQNSKAFWSFEENTVEISHKKYISVINDITTEQLNEFNEYICRLPGALYILLLVESEKGIKEIENKYLKVEFELDRDLWDKLSVAGTLYFDTKYPEYYVRLHIQSLLRYKKMENKIIMVKAEQLIDLTASVVKELKLEKSDRLYIIIDCLTSTAPISSETDLNIPKGCNVVYLKKSSDESKWTKLSLNLTDGFLQSKEFRQNKITFQDRDSSIENVFPGLNSENVKKWFEKDNLSLLMQLLEKHSKVKIGEEPPCNFDIEARYIPCAEEISFEDFKIILEKFYDSSIFVVNGDVDYFEKELRNLDGSQSLININAVDDDDEKFQFKQYCRQFHDKFVYLLRSPDKDKNMDKFVIACFFHSNLYKSRTFTKLKNNIETNQSNEIQINEGDFVEKAFSNSMHVKVLLDQSGMGKSTTLNAMCKDYFNKNFSDWVAFVDLKSINFKLMNEHTPETFLYSLLNVNATAEYVDFTKLAMQYRLENCEKNLNIFLDAFDEITFRGETNKTEKTDNSLKAQKKNFLNFLALFKKKFPTVKIIMTSRIHERDNFWRNFEFYNFLNIDKSFLFNNWDVITRIFYDKSQEETDIKLKQIELKKYSTDLIGEAEKKLGTDLRFLGFPLHLRMLSEINIKYVVGFVSNKCSLPSVQDYSILKIFEQYIQTKYEIQGRKDGITSVKYLEPFIQKSEKNLRLLAFMNNPRIFDHGEGQAYFRRWVKGDDFKNIQTMANHNETELLSTGIIQKIERCVKYNETQIIVRFNHKLFEQYYSTRKWFEIIRSHLLNPTFYIRENVCSFNEEIQKYLTEFSEYFLVDLIQQDEEVQSKLFIKPDENDQFRLCMEQLTQSGGENTIKKLQRVYTFFRTFSFFPFFDILYGDFKYYIPVQTPFSSDAIEIQALTLYLNLSSARESKRWDIVRDILQFSIETFKEKIQNQLRIGSIQNPYLQVERYIYDNKTLRFLYKFYKRKEFKIPGFLIKLLKTSEEIKSRFLRYHIDILMTFLAPEIFVNDSCQENNIIVQDFEHACIKKLKTKDYHIAVYDCSETKMCNIISEYVERLAFVVGAALCLYKKYGSWEEFVIILGETYEHFIRYHKNDWNTCRLIMVTYILDTIALSEFKNFNYYSDNYVKNFPREKVEKFVRSVKSLLSSNKEYELHFSELYGWRFEYKVLLKKLISEIRPDNHMLLKAEIDKEAEIDEVFSGEVDEKINTLLRVQTTPNAFNMNPVHYDMLCDVIMDNKSHSYLNYFQRLKEQFPPIESPSISNLSYTDYKYSDSYDHDYEVPDNNEVSDEDVGVTIPFSVIPPFPYNNNASNPWRRKLWDTGTMSLQEIFAWDKVSNVPTGNWK